MQYDAAYHLDVEPRRSPEKPRCVVQGCPLKTQVWPDAELWLVQV